MEKPLVISLFCGLGLVPFLGQGGPGQGELVLVVLFLAGRLHGPSVLALGVVELTVGLANQFDFLKDRIVWDVGHQAHVYKILTGRASRFADYGKWGGLCKFLERRESPYDHMGAGHASTSVSAALGMAIARDLQNQAHHVRSPHLGQQP